MPLQPNWPNVPVLAGMNGVQLWVARVGRLSRYHTPKPMTASRTETLVMTIRLLKVADSLMPM